MYFRLLLVILMFGGAPVVQAKEKRHTEPVDLTLQASPNKCVALREGSACYAVVTLDWAQNKVGDYCLRNQATKKIIQCWLAKQTGQYAYEFNSDQTLQFELINTQTGQVLGQTQVLVNWVYTNKQKKRRWRLF